MRRDNTVRLPGAAGTATGAGIGHLEKRNGREDSVAEPGAQRRAHPTVIEETFRPPLDRLLSELNYHQRDRVAIDYGVQRIRQIPRAFLIDMTEEEATALARALGRPVLRRKLAEVAR
jgi:hypothetical protein